MPKITLDLEDDEFLELGGLGFSVATWNTDAQTCSFGRLLLKIKERIEKRATPGQIIYLNKVVQAIREAATLNPENIETVTDSCRLLMADAGILMETNDTLDRILGSEDSKDDE
jgi:hypothetical protein